MFLSIDCMCYYIFKGRKKERNCCNFVKLKRNLKIRKTFAFYFQCLNFNTLFNFDTVVGLQFTDESMSANARISDDGRAQVDCANWEKWIFLGQRRIKSFSAEYSFSYSLRRFSGIERLGRTSSWSMPRDLDVPHRYTFEPSMLQLQSR